MRDMQSEGAKFPPGYCIKNASRQCAFPHPDVLPNVLPIVDLFTLTDGCVTASGMNDVPRCRTRTEVRSVADALSVPWDEHTLQCFEILERFWLQSEWRAIKARQKQK